MAATEIQDLEKATSSPDGEISKSRIVEPQAATTSLSDEEEPFEPAPPLQTLTSIRGRRAVTHIQRGFREYMHGQKVKAKSWFEEADGNRDALNHREISHIEFLHRYNILSLPVKVLRHLRGEYDDTLMNPGVASEVLRDLSDYTTALRDYRFFHNEGKDLFRMRQGPDLVVSNRILLEAASAELEKLPRGSEDAEKLKDLIREYRKAITKSFTRVLAQTTSGMSKELETKERKAMLAHLLMAPGGGLALIAPVIIMVLHPTRLTAILTTSCFVFAVAVGLAIFMDDSQPKDVMACTAAYRAVLVVFVGVGGGTPEP